MELKQTSFLHFFCQCILELGIQLVRYGILYKTGGWFNVRVVISPIVVFFFGDFSLFKLTIEERAKEIATFIRNNYGKYDNVPVKVKAEQFQFSNDDLDADMELHSLVLKELNEKMYGADSFEDYMRLWMLRRKSSRVRRGMLSVIVMIRDGIGVDKLNY